MIHKRINRQTNLGPCKHKSRDINRELSAYTIGGLLSLHLGWGGNDLLEEGRNNSEVITLPGNVSEAQERQTKGYDREIGKLLVDLLQPALHEQHHSYIDRFILCAINLYCIRSTKTYEDVENRGSKTLDLVDIRLGAVTNLWWSYKEKWNIQYQICLLWIYDWKSKAIQITSKPWHCVAVSIVYILIKTDACMHHSAHLKLQKISLLLVVPVHTRV